MDTQWTFEDLDVWQEGRKLRQELSMVVKGFPGWEKSRLVDQIIRASRSVTANLAEGYGRFHFQENIQFCRHSRGSLFELIDHVITSFDEGYINEPIMKDLKKKIYVLIKKLNGYIKHLKTQKAKK